MAIILKSFEGVLFYCSPPYPGRVLMLHFLMFTVLHTTKLFCCHSLRYDFYKDGTQMFMFLQLILQFIC